MIIKSKNCLNIESFEKLCKELEDNMTWWDRYIVSPFYQSFWCHVEAIYYGLKHLPGNLKKWAMFVWHDRDWDYSYTLQALEIKCHSQSKSIGLYGNSIDKDKHSEQAKKMAEVLKRLREENYWDDNQPITKEEYEKGQEERNKDIQYLKDHIEELFTWWE